MRFAVVIIFVVYAAIAAFAGKLPFLVPGLYLGASIAAFTAYAFDKSAAQGNKWRTRESTLLFLGLIGGWPGALLAQCVLRHKSKKHSFQLQFWVTVMVNSVGLLWLLTQMQ